MGAAPQELRPSEEEGSTCQPAPWQEGHWWNNYPGPAHHPVLLAPPVGQATWKPEGRGAWLAQMWGGQLGSAEQGEKSGRAGLVGKQCIQHEHLFALGGT